MDEIEKRKKAREFAKQSLSKNKPLDWFEKLYIVNRAQPSKPHRQGVGR